MTTSKLTTIENKIPDVSNLFKKTDYDTKISEIEKKLTNHKHDIYITNCRKFCCNITQANLIIKTDFDAKLSSLNRKITSNKTKHLLIEIKLKKFKTSDLSYFIGKDYFDKDVGQIN